MTASEIKKSIGEWESFGERCQIKCPACDGECKQSSAWAKEAISKVKAKRKAKKV